MLKTTAYGFKVLGRIVFDIRADNPLPGSIEKSALVHQKEAKQRKKYDLARIF